MPKSNSLSGRVSYVILLFSGVIILWGIVSFFTTHETLGQHDSRRFIYKESLLDSLPEVKNLQVKTLIFTTQSSDKKTIFVNGMLKPTISIRPGEVQRWRVSNQSKNSFVNFMIPGFSFYIVARDGNATTIPISQTEELLAPSDSVEVLVLGPGWGTYEIFSGSIEGSDKNFLLELRSEGLPVLNTSIPETLVPNYDLRSAKASGMRTFSIDQLQEEYSPQKLQDKSIEEWKITNDSDSLKSFFLKDYLFQVIEINNDPIERYGYDNVFSVPPNGSITIRVK